jgi:FeS assembly SUF system regulator
MLRITKQTDYGIVLLTRMAAELEERHTAPDLAEKAQLPLPTVSKILKLLARDGLLASHRGVKGGYSLSRPPGDITIAEIIGSLEGPIAITECIDDGGPHDCVQQGRCATQANWQIINRAIRGALAEITLKDMADQQVPLQLVQLGAHRAVATR